MTHRECIRSPHQQKFHEAFIRAAARIIYREEWPLKKDTIMRHNGWETARSEVLISTPRRFGKTFSLVCRGSNSLLCICLWIVCVCCVLVAIQCGNVYRVHRPHVSPRDCGLQYAPRVLLSNIYSMTAYDYNLL